MPSNRDSDSIGAACKKWLADHGDKPLTMREQIDADAKEGSQKRKKKPRTPEEEADRIASELEEGWDL